MNNLLRRQINLKVTGRINAIYRLNSFSSTPEFTRVVMPSLSPTMTHGTIAAWNVKEGQAINVGDVLCEIETDKASVGFEMQDSGVLAKVLVEAHVQDIKCGDVIAIVVEDEAAFQQFKTLDPTVYTNKTTTNVATPAAPAPAPLPINVANTIVAESSNSADGNSSKVLRISPAARHHIESKNLDVSSLTGSLKGGMIGKGDVLQGLKSGVVRARAANNQHQTVNSASQQQVTATAPAVVSAFNPADLYSKPANSNYTDIPNSNMRKVIAKRLSESKQQVPHYYTTIQCNIDKVLALRKQLKQDLDVNVSVNDIVIKAAALALRDFPEVNAKFSAQKNAIVHGAGQVDISVAVATPTGLITPIVAGADKLSVAQINSTVKELAGRARSGKLKPEEYQGGSFSISNLGMYGTSSFSAVINPPQACILAVGSSIPRLVPTTVFDKQSGSSTVKLTTSNTVQVQLSSDRRVVDETLAAQFLQTFQHYFSNPNALLL